MTTPNYLSDALSKNASLLNGVLSQMSGAFGANDAGGGLFSSLLSAENGIDAAGLTLQQSDIPTPAAALQSSDTINASASGASGGNDILSSPLSASLESSATASTSNLLQNLDDIAQNLQKILTALHQAKQRASQNSGTSARQSDAAPSSVRQAVGASAASSAGATATSTTAATATASTAASVASDSSKTLSDIIAELLAMVQLLTLAVKQAATPVVTGATATSGGTTIQAADATTGQSGAMTAATASTSANASPLLQMLQALEKDVQQLLPAADVTPTTTPATAADLNLAASSGTASDSAGSLAAQFASLDQALKQVAAGLQQAFQAQPVQSNSQISVPIPTPAQAQIATQSDAKNAAAALTVSLPREAAPDPATTTTASNAPQNRLSPPTAQSQPAAQTQAQIGVQTAAQAQLQQPATQTQQPVAAALNAAAFVSAAKDSLAGDSDSSAFMSNNNAASGGDGGQNATAGLAADGMQATGTYTFASTLSAIRATNGGTTGLPSVVDQVILQMNRSVKNGNDQVSLQLHPADLGKITVKLDMSGDGKVQGTVTADNPHTLAMLQKDSRSLERALQDAGLRADPGSLQFNLSSQQNQNQSGQTAENNAGNDGQATADGTQNAEEDTSATAIALPAETYYVTPTGVNIRV